MTVAVVTATKGRDTLFDTFFSVQNQTYACAHYIFAHGFYPRFEPDLVLGNTHTIALPHNLGANGHGCGPVYAAAPFLVKEDIILYLDDDNWFERNHVESLVGPMIEYNCEWGYSLRRIVDHDGNFICNDDCESLGAYQGITNHLIDQSCFAIKKSLAQTLTKAWMTPVTSDRFVTKALLESKTRFIGSGKHSVNYRLSKDGSGSMTAEKFLDGNKAIEKFYEGRTPWRERRVFEYPGLKNE